MNQLTRLSRGGFTLIELLVVILIIGILAALLVPAVMGARNRALETGVIADIGQLDMKLQDYKSRFGSYPPDFSSFATSLSPPPDPTPVNVRRHMSGAFPRSTRGFYKSIVELYKNDPQWATPGKNKPTDLDAAEALVFWLGGVSIGQGNDSSKLRGFSRNPTNPFEGSSQKQRLQAMYEFDPTRLVDRDDDGWYEYIPPARSGGSETPPYVYFHHRSYTAETDSIQPVESRVFYPKQNVSPDQYADEWGHCVPYRADPSQDSNNGMGRGWVNPQKFQIISAGLDGRYGDVKPDPKFYPSGETFPVSAKFGYQLGDLDNLTNFSSSTLEDAQP